MALPVHRRLFDGLEGAEHSEGDGEHEDEERGDGLVPTTKRHPAPWARSDYVPRGAGRRTHGDGLQRLGVLDRAVCISA